MTSYRLLFCNDISFFRLGWETVRDALLGKKTKQIRSFGTVVLDFPVTEKLFCAELIRKIFR